MLGAVVAAFAGGVARADGLGATVEPGYSHVETDVTDQAGGATHERADLLTQNYRLSFDRSLTDSLAVAVGATLLDEKGWKETDGVASDAHGRTTSYFGRLTLGAPVLSGGLGVDRRDQRALASSSDFVTETYGAYASWRPLQLPELDLRAGEVNTFDAARRAQDTTTDTASFAARYTAPTFDVRYLLGWSRTADRLRGSVTTGVEQTVLANRKDTLFGGRTTTYVSGTLQSRNVLVESRGEGGTVARQQLPVAGLSGVEAFPATAGDIVLSPNPQLVDGNVTRPSDPTGGQSASSVNVGFGPTALGDRDRREVGAQFADLTSEVNTLYVWFDRTLEPEVAGAFVAPCPADAPDTCAMQVYQSDDNRFWIPVTAAAPLVPSPFENRIEITIPRTPARFLKVAIRPLATGVTTSAAFRDLFVTEIQLLQVLPVTLVPRRQSAVGTSATAYARTVILRSANLAHDLSATISRDSENPRTRYTLVNGLSVGRKLWWGISGNARGARQDQDAGRGHEGEWQWSAALAARPLPTAYWTLTYSGNWRRSDQVTHALSALGRADWYPGISTEATAGASTAVRGTRTASAVQASSTTSLTPNAVVTLSVGGLYSRSLATSPEEGGIVTQFARVDASASITPAPALSGSGTVSRVLIGAQPSTLGTLQLNYFPLRGDLQLAIAYSNTFDTAAAATTRILTPSLRWNIRRGVSLTSSYTLLRNVAPVQTLDSRALWVTLLITL